MPGAEAIARSAGGALVGVGLGELTARRTRALAAEQQVMLNAAGLAIVAAIYPACRRRWRLDRSSAGELLGVVAYCTASLVAVRRSPPQATRLLAAGWASHALFDIAHGHDEGSRLPRWYPAFCAAYDLVLGASASSTSTSLRQSQTGQPRRARNAQGDDARARESRTGTSPEPAARDPRL